MHKMKFLMVLLLFGITMGVLLPAYNIFKLQPSITSALIENTEKDAIKAARHLSGGLFRQQHGSIKQQLTPELCASIVQLKNDFGFYKIKVFDALGYTLFSTATDDIGKRNEKDYFHQKVALGQTLTHLVKRSKPSLDGPLISGDVVETYVPIHLNGHFAGAFEIYYDVTEDINSLQAVIDNSSIFLILVTVIFLILLAVVATRERKAIAGQLLAEQELRHLAYFDNLTGLPNRTLFLDRLNQAISRSHRDEKEIALLFFDLDDFKEINDQYGHHVGDLLLQEAAQRVQALVRKSDTLARIGGDEFAFLITSLENDQGAAVVAQKVLEVISEPFALEGKNVDTSISIGIATLADDKVNADALQTSADIAMHAAQKQGGNTYTFFSEERNQQELQRRELLADLQQALENDEFFLVYQPQMDLHTKKIVGAEALVRWNHPQKGIIPPAEFIPLAEESGLIEQVGNWVLKQACQQNKSWQDAGYPCLRVAVNLSALQLRRPMFVSEITSILDGADLDPQWLELELTESLIMDDAESSREILSSLSRLGIHLAIDDFGTGYSSFSYLKFFDVDRIKIDRSFVVHIPFDQSDSAIIETILAMAKILKLEVVAEGVETEEQLEFLKNLDCQIAQGFYLAKPMEANAFEAYMEARADNAHSFRFGMDQQELQPT